MMSISQFLLESSVCLAIFYAFYYFVLRKETFFQLNRIYLLLTPFLSFLIPLLQIDLSKPPAQVLNETPTIESLIYPAVSNATAVNNLIWERIDKPTIVYSLTIADFLFIIYIIGALFMLFRLSRGLWGLRKVIKVSQQNKETGYTVVKTDSQFPAASFFSYVFWNANKMSKEQKLILEHELVHIRQWHSLDVLLIELWVIIKWFNPLIYLYRKSLQATHEYIADRFVSRKATSVHQYASLLVHHSQNHSCNPLMNNFAALIKKRLKMLGQKDSSYWRILKYLLSIPVFISLMLLFSFNLVEEIPTNRVSNSLSNLEIYLDDLSEKTIVAIEKEYAPKDFAVWGGVEIPMTQVNSKDELSLNVKVLSSNAYDKLKDFVIEFKANEKTNDFNSFLALFETNDGLVFECDNLDDFYNNAVRMDKEFTIFIRIVNEAEEAYFSALTVSDTGIFYNNTSTVYHLFDLENHPVINRLQYFVDEEATVQLADLTISEKEDYHLEWGELQFQALKVGEPLQDPIDISAVSVSDFQKLKEENFNLVINNSCLHIDSVFTMVISEKNGSYRCKDKWSDDSCYRSFLYDIDDPATVYLIMKTRGGAIYSSIVSIGEESTLYLENEQFVSQLLQFPTTKFNASNVVHTQNNYELMWGGLQMELSRKENNRFIGTIEVSRDEFIKAIQQEPILGLKKGGLFENVSFGMTVKHYRENGSRSIRTTAVESLINDKDTYFENERLFEYAKVVHTGDEINLTSISYGEFMPDRLSVTIKITSGKKEAVKNRKNSFQFHWGQMDIDLNENSAGIFQSKVKIPKSILLESIKNDPVLTSKFKGVLNAFDFELIYKKEGEKKLEKYSVESNTQRSNYYENSFPTKLLDKIAVGDYLEIRTLKTDEIEEEALHIHIKVVEDVAIVEAEKSTVSTDKPILFWGDYEFDLKKINDDKSDQEMPLRTIHPDFFDRIKCNELALYSQKKKLDIKETSIIIHGKDFQEHCRDVAWDDTCLQEKFNLAKDDTELILFFKTKEKENFMLRFLLAEKGEDKTVLGFGNRDTTNLVMEVFKDYQTKVYEPSTQRYSGSINASEWTFYWGDIKVPYDQIENPTIFGNETTIHIDDFAAALNKSIKLKHKDSEHELKTAWLTLLHRKGSNYTYSYDVLDNIGLDCYDNQCYIPYEDLDEVLGKVKSGDYIINFGWGNFDFNNPVYEPVNMKFNIDDPSIWIPKVALKGIPKMEDFLYEFQVVKRPNRQNIVRMDTTSEKYRWMYESYQNNQSAEVVHVPDFKTTRRLIDKEIIEKKDIKKVELLTNDMTDIWACQEFTDFDEDEIISLHWRGFEGRFDEKKYCIDDFINNDDKLTLTINGKVHPVTKYELLIKPSEGAVSQYITDSNNDNEVQEIIEKLEPQTSVYLTNLLIENEAGEPLLFPTSYVFNLE